MAHPDAGHDPAPGPDADRTDTSGLSERDLAVLAFERTWWRHAGAKEEAIRGSFSISPARYYQLVDSLIDRPEALRHDPMLIGRLQRLRESRVARRAARAELRRPSGR
nr:DUF3263 domain-containing protein [Amnibacterium flavum]